MNVTTALIFASGYGSRMLPITAAVQKELLPILDRPVIDYVVADCLAAGIRNIIFHVRPDIRPALENYYLGNAGLEAHLARYGKHEALAKLQAIHAQANFSFVEFPSHDHRYGTAIPLIHTAPHLPSGEAFVVCGGDDFLWRTDGGSDIADLVQTFRRTGATGGLIALEQPSSELHRYGVLSVEDRAGEQYLKNLVEKPAPGEAPSNLTNLSKYLLTPPLLDYVFQVQPDPKSGEYYITDAIRQAALEHPIVVQSAQGRFLDAGNLNGWLEANQVLASAQLVKN